MYEKPSLSMWEWVTLLTGITRTCKLLMQHFHAFGAVCTKRMSVGATLGAVVTGPIRGAKGTPTYKQHVFYSAIRAMTQNLSAVQSQ